MTCDRPTTSEGEEPTLPQKFVMAGTSRGSLSGARAAPINEDNGGAESSSAQAEETSKTKLVAHRIPSQQPQSIAVPVPVGDLVS